MNLNQIIFCLSIGMLSFGMMEKSFATSADKEVEAAKQGQLFTYNIAVNLAEKVKDGEWVIPGEYTVIDKGTFRNNSNLKIKKIDFGNVISIEEEAFYDCRELTDIDFKNVQSIGKSAFSLCARLTNVDFKNVQSIGARAFSTCRKLTDINFGKVRSIDKCAFWSCEALTRVDFGEVQSIGRSAFNNCRELTKIDLKNVESIEGAAFRSCAKLTGINLRNVKSIGEFAFSECTQLKSITIPDSVTSIGQHVFCGCTNLKSINVYSKRVKQMILESDHEIDENIIHIVEEGSQNEASTLSDGDILSRISNLEARIQSFGGFDIEKADPVLELYDSNIFDKENEFIEASKPADAKRRERRDNRNSQIDVNLTSNDKKAFNDTAFYGKSKKAYKAFLIAQLGKYTEEAQKRGLK